MKKFSDLNDKNLKLEIKYDNTLIELKQEKEKNEKNKKLYNSNISSQKEINDNYNKLLKDYKQLNAELTQEKLN